MKVINDTYLKLPYVATEEMFQGAMKSLAEISNGMIDMRTYDGSSIFANYYAFYYLTDDESLVEKYYSQLVLPNDSTERKIIKSLMKSYTSVFFITNVIEKE